MLYKVHCNVRACEGSFIVDDGGSETAPNNGCYCGRTNSDVEEVEAEKAETKGKDV